MSSVGQTMVKGHGLVAEGLPLYMAGCPLPPCSTDCMGRLGGGHGKCRCGAMSPHLDSTYARKAWHRQHKAAVKAAQ